MIEVMQQIAATAETPGERTLQHSHVSRWPAGALEKCLEIGILLPSPPAETCWCEECELECIIRPTVRERQDGGIELTHVCHERPYGRLVIRPELLRRWTVAANRLAMWVMLELDLKGYPLPERPDIWKIGTRASRSYVLALGWRDPSFRRHLEATLARLERPVVLSPRAPRNPEHIPAPWVALDSILGKRGFSLDVDKLDAHLRQQRHFVSPATTAAIATIPSWEALTLRILDDETLEIELDGKRQAWSFVALGLFDRRAEQGGPREVLRTLFAVAEAESKQTRIARHWSDSARSGGKVST